MDILKSLYERLKYTYMKKIWGVMFKMIHTY